MLYQQNMTCKDCPYIKDEFEGRKAYLEHKGYDDPEISHSCYCDKVGGKLGWYGYCSEAEIIEEDYVISKHISAKEKRRNRIRAKEKYKKKLKWQSTHYSHYPCPAYPSDKDGHWTDDEDKLAYYKRIYKSSHASRYKFFKKLSNRLVRRQFRIEDTWEWYCFHEPWMDEDPEYMELYCDEFGWEWDIRAIIDSDPKYDISDGGSYKKVFDYWWTVD